MSKPDEKAIEEAMKNLKAMAAAVKESKNGAVTCYACGRSVTPEPEDTHLKYSCPCGKWAASVGLPRS